MRKIAINQKNLNALKQECISYAQNVYTDIDVMMEMESEAESARTMAALAKTDIFAMAVGNVIEINDDYILVEM